MYWEICGDWRHGSEGSFADAARDNFQRILSGEERHCGRAKFFF